MHSYLAISLVTNVQATLFVLILCITSKLQLHTVVNILLM